MTLMYKKNDKKYDFFGVNYEIPQYIGEDQIIKKFSVGQNLLQVKKLNYKNKKQNRT